MSYSVELLLPTPHPLLISHVNFLPPRFLLEIYNFPYKCISLYLHKYYCTEPPLVHNTLAWPDKQRSECASLFRHCIYVSACVYQLKHTRLATYKSMQSTGVAAYTLPSPLLKHFSLSKCIAFYTHDPCHTHTQPSSCKQSIWHQIEL